MVKIYKWINRDKSRYYIITVQKDGGYNIIIQCLWGGDNSNWIGNKNVILQSEEEVQSFLRDMTNRRRKRGYDLIT
jgi:hypothetical protein